MTKALFLDRLSEITRQKRLEKGYSQRELASMIRSKGIDNNYICQIENRRKQGMSIDVLLMLMDALDIELDFAL